MHNFKFIFSLLFFSVLLVFTGIAQNNVIRNPPDQIKSIVLRSKLTNNYTPIIRLGEGFTLEFDDLSYDQEEYTYKIEHYDYDWQPSGLISTEYINGYSSDYIRDFENSFNTLQPYTYYKLQIPNDNTQIKLSGNYVISVLNNYDEVLFSRPFIVYDSQVDVGVSVHRNRDIASLNTKQSLQFTINHPNLLINNPSQEIKVAIYQNNDWNTVIKDLKPQFYRGSQLIYKYIDKISFWAGNEFLFFDTKQIRTANNNIARVTLNDIFDSYLYLDEERLHRPYTLYPDINGNFVIRSVDGGETSTEADYTWVHFRLETFENIGQDNIYVYGNFNGWQLTEENKMSFDERLKIYTCKLLLKQGFYNYLYVTANEVGKINNHAIEGSFYQAENDYTVLVYYKPFGSRYDQVIGYGSANSENLRN
ncbi:MAG: DUF5103 domain-containing protein [Aureibaculum sp.]